MPARLISLRSRVTSTAGFDEMSSTRTTPKLYTSLLSVSW
uniref:Uncharacterized protein n=1 Tax=Arundo donax TaxID=35708 RepID=A0A0A9A6M8_ARUDO